MGRLKDGEQVLDAGSGAGMDSLIANHMVGSSGHVTGVDMTDAILARARSSAAESGATNVEFVKGDATELPPADNSIDVVISNGVFNLVPAKAKAVQEWFRVLKPGGRLQIADIVVNRAVPFEAKEDIDLWTG
jgi:arsenite methyltransferase